MLSRLRRSELWLYRIPETVTGLRKYGANEAAAVPLSPDYGGQEIDKGFDERARTTSRRRKSCRPDLYRQVLRRAMTTIDLLKTEGAFSTLLRRRLTHVQDAVNASMAAS